MRTFLTSKTHFMIVFYQGEKKNHFFLIWICNLDRQVCTQWWKPHNPPRIKCNIPRWSSDLQKSTQRWDFCIFTEDLFHNNTLLDKIYSGKNTFLDTAPSKENRSTASLIKICKYPQKQRHMFNSAYSKASPLCSTEWAKCWDK